MPGQYTNWCARAMVCLVLWLDASRRAKMCGRWDFGMTIRVPLRMRPLWCDRACRTFQYWRVAVGVFLMVAGKPC